MPKLLSWAIYDKWLLISRVYLKPIMAPVLCRYLGSEMGKFVRRASDQFVMLGLTVLPLLIRRGSFNITIMWQLWE